MNGEITTRSMAWLILDLRLRFTGMEFGRRRLTTVIQQPAAPTAFREISTDTHLQPGAMPSRNLYVNMEGTE
jgi:hypothetical protein